MLDSRIEEKRLQGKKTDTLCISVEEPEAVVQRQNRGRGSAPGYKPSVLANEQRIVVGQAVEASSETAAIEPMLEQSESVSGAAVEILLLDAGYFCDGILEQSIERDINLLCPEGRTPGQGKVSTRYYRKSPFDDADQDIYRCSAGQSLLVLSRSQGGNRSASYTEYGSPACKTCAQKSRCTRSKESRRIRRYAGDDAKDALRQVMRQPATQGHFSKRQAWVESVFSVLRGKQGFNRFRRKGLVGERLEFSLHIIACNMGGRWPFLYIVNLAILCRIVTRGSALWDRIKWTGCSGVYFFRLSGGSLSLFHYINQQFCKIFILLRPPP